MERSDTLIRVCRETDWRASACYARCQTEKLTTLNYANRGACVYYVSPRHFGMLLIQQNIAHSFQSPIVRVLLGTIAIALLYVFYREVRKIPAKLFTLMITAFVDMVGLLMIIPLLPFYVKSLGGSGINVLGLHLGVGSLSGIIVAAFTIAQLA